MFHVKQIYDKKTANIRSNVSRETNIECFTVLRRITKDDKDLVERTAISVVFSYKIHKKR